MLKDLALRLVPRLRQARDQIHNLHRLYTEAMAENVRLRSERDDALRRLGERGKADEIASPAAAPANEPLAADLEAARKELRELERAYRSSVALNTKLLAQLPNNART